MAQFNPYQPYSPYQQNNPYIQQQMQSNNINWVQGIEGAKAWQIQPNSNAIMLDSENDGVFYIKTSDNVGICKLRVFKYQEVTEQPKQSNIDLSEYVKKSELETILASIIGGSNEKQSVSTTQPENKSGKFIAK